MTSIDYYFSALSPYTYLAGTRLETIAERAGAKIVYRPLDPVALFARTGGTRPQDRHPSRQEYRAQDLQRLARKLNVRFNLKPAHWPTNGAPSAYAVIAAARARGAGADGDVGALVHGLAAACWAEERDIAQDDVIRDCLAAAGFDPGLADADLLYSADAYGANLEHAAAQGAFGVPFYICEDGQAFWGQDRLEDLGLYLGLNPDGKP